MPKFPVVKDIKLIKILKKLGFFEHTEKGSSHLVFKHLDGRRTTVARHRKEIPIGTLKSILKDIDVSNEEFKKLL